MGCQNEPNNPNQWNRVNNGHHGSLTATIDGWGNGGIVRMITPIRGMNTMARLPIEQQIAQLEERTKALKARMAKQDRAKDTRRKILLGALVLHRLEQNGDGEFSKRLGDWLKRELPGFLTRDEDKALFADLLSDKPASSQKVITPTEPVKSES